MAFVQAELIDYHDYGDRIFVAYLITDDTKVEKKYVEHFLLAGELPNDAALPDVMAPVIRDAHEAWLLEPATTEPIKLTKAQLEARFTNRLITSLPSKIQKL